MMIPQFHLGFHNAILDIGCMGEDLLAEGGQVGVAPCQGGGGEIVF
jgi:hypothetical protein